MGERLGIYIHIPFCKSKCNYCDFYSLPDQLDRMADYQKALLLHIKETAPLAVGIEVDTVYFGGGTPTFYGEKRLKELLRTIKKNYRLADDAEITCEANPDSCTLKSLRTLRRVGFNRISIGMQSVDRDQLLTAGRVHTPEQTVLAVDCARKAKLKNLSLDLIYGLPGQTMENWHETVEAALALNPEHLSCYGLKVEEGTPLAHQVADGLILPDDDMQADLYLWTVSRLQEAGFEQYEISNFAKPGYASRHNLRYWLTQPYIGFGPGAHSDFGDRRYSFVRDLDRYITGLLKGGDITDDNDLIPLRERSGEYLMLRLRTTHGIEEWEYRKQFFMDFAPLEERLVEFSNQNLTEKTPEGRWRLTPSGFLLSNRIIGDLLERQTEENLQQKVANARIRFAPKKQSE